MSFVMLLTIFKGMINMNLDYEQNKKMIKESERIIKLINEGE